MNSLARPYPQGYAFGLRVPDDVPTAAIQYVPLKIACPTCETTECVCAPEPWSADDRAEWLAAEMADARAERGNW